MKSLYFAPASVVLMMSSSLAQTYAPPSVSDAGAIDASPTYWLVVPWWIVLLVIIATAVIWYFARGHHKGQRERSD
jgi:hypothetical protein